MGAKKNQKQSQLIIEDLIKRSKDCQMFVRKSMLSQKIEYQELSQALQHYFSYWNDFTHPGIFSLACEAVGGDPANHLEAQVAIAMLGASFDIHDDIIDGSQTKHNYPTVFGKYGENVALLLGNAFMIYGFTLMGKATNKLASEKIDRIFATLRVSLFDVGNAHASELGLRRRLDASPDEYIKIIENKAASIEADMNIAAILSGGTAEECKALARYGRIMGTLATLREEFIDIFEAEELNQRIKTEAYPIPVLYAFQDKDSSTDVKRLLSKKELTNKEIEELLDIVMESKSVANLRNHMLNLIGQAQRTLSSIRNQETKKLLANMVKATLEDL
ncbi:MAG: polyprenyl synthetase family protein [Candidatus Bathyarchaeia archaeon]